MVPDKDLESLAGAAPESTPNTLKDGLADGAGGFARVPASWPAPEKAFQQKIDDVAKKMMKTMSS